MRKSSAGTVLSLMHLVLLPSPQSNSGSTNDGGTDERGAFRVGVGIPVFVPILRRPSLRIISLRRHGLWLVGLRRKARSRPALIAIPFAHVVIETADTGWKTRLGQLDRRLNSGVGCCIAEIRRKIG